MDQLTTFHDRGTKPSYDHALQNQIVGLQDTIQMMQANLQKLLEQLHNITFYVKRREDGEYVFTLFEGRLARALGLVSENLLDKPVRFSLPEEIWRKLVTYYDRAYLGEWVFFHLTWEGRMFYVSVVPVFDENERVTRLHGMGIGITECNNEVMDRMNELNRFKTMLEMPGVTEKTGKEFFNHLVLYLTKWLNVKLALIGMLDKEEKGKFHTCAFAQDGQLIDNICYLLENTPCETVLQHKICSYPEQVQKQFPLDEALKEYDIESYIGISLQDSNGETMGLLAVMDNKPMRDIRLMESVLKIFALRAAAELERKMAEDELLKSNAILQATQESTPVAILIHNERDQIISCNHNFLKFFAVTEECIENGNSEQIFNYMLANIADADKIRQIIQNSRKHPLDSHQTEFTLKDGRVFEGHTSPIRSSQGQHYGRIWHFTDVTERKRYEEQLAIQAYYDPLTGLANSALFHDRLELALSQANRSKELLGVMFIDLDRFKYVNDTLSHFVGDVLLQEVSKRLSSCIRNGDTLSRLGSDEFKMILPVISGEEDAEKMAQSILDQFREPFVMEGNELYITCSIGISIFPSDGTDGKALLKNAVAASYRAKEKGGNNYQLYTPSMNTRTFQKLALEKELRKAIERSELVVYYQPRVSLSTGKLIGMEALVRWEHPVLGRIPPGEFIPLAEETGLIVSLDEYVLRTACAQTKAWQEAGYPPLRVGVNLTAVQFHKQNVVEYIKGILNDTGLEPQYLELEITEGVTMHKVETAIVTLQQLKELGVQIAIDDFGTGYSSLSYLKKFPIHTLKIDRSFIQDITENTDDAEIVSCIITLAHGLKLKVIAEGVETEGQMKYLWERSCDEMQGFLYSPPLPKEEFEELLKRMAYEEIRKLAD